MKKIFLISVLQSLFVFVAFTQDTTAVKEKEERRIEKRERKSAIIKQEEEGVLSYNKQTGFGIQLRTNGYGIFFELGKRASPRFTNLYVAELTEIRNDKQAKSANANGVFSNSYQYGKINNFYQFKLGYGQQYIFGQKGNKNGIAVLGIYNGGFSLGMLRPYYLDVNSGNKRKSISYFQDSTLFLNNSAIIGSSGISKGWNELKFKPGIYAKGALRFDFGRYNDMVQAIEIGSSIEAYANKIQIMAPIEAPGDAIEPKRIFYQINLAFVFGRRK